MRTLSGAEFAALLARAGVGQAAFARLAGVTRPRRWWSPSRRRRSA